MKRIVFLGVILLFISGCVAEVKETENKTEVNETKAEPAELTKELCESSGGKWNECGSACRGAPPDIVCIAVCVEYCECLGNEQCPQGYECVEYIDNVGICKA